MKIAIGVLNELMTSLMFQSLIGSNENCNDETECQHDYQPGFNP